MVLQSFARGSDLRVTVIANNPVSQFGVRLSEKVEMVSSVVHMTIALRARILPVSLGSLDWG